MGRWFPLILLLVAGAAARADNPFGLMLRPAAGQDYAMAAARAAGLQVAWFRPPTQYADSWRPDSPCRACRDLQRSGLSLALTVRRGKLASQDGFAHALNGILDRWKPALLVIESEEDSVAESPEAYAAELAQACAAAHERGIRCSNGGLSFRMTEAMACFHARTIQRREAPALCGNAAPSDLDRAASWAEIYRAAPIDLVNFHWSGSDAVALAQTCEALARFIGKPVMSNDIAEPPGDAAPGTIRPLMRAAMAGGLKVAIWNSVDGRDSVSLFEADGRLRPAGIEFAHQMSGLK